jgi:NAD(P)-dependent dehydrogenase (short-subunit alcohol dehydrogenase family)
VELSGASVLVTGAGRGIGRAVALGLGREGARVTALARSAAELETLVQELRAGGGQALSYPGDLRHAAVCDGAVRAAVAAHGGLQVLVNNAAVAAFANLEDTTDEDWLRTLETNLTAPFRLTRAALPHLIATGGHVVMISSLAGKNPIAGLSAYCASKAALDHLAACLMLEVRHHGIKVTTVAPGSVDTGFGAAAGNARGDAGWMLTADDVAATIVALLRERDDAHTSRVEMRPLRPPRK